MAEQFTLQFPDGRTFGPAPIETIEQWSRQGRVDRGAVLVAPGSLPMAARDHPSLSAILNAPPTVPFPVVGPPSVGASGLIPYRNPAALTGYYSAVLSLVPVVAVLAGPAAVGLGVLGWRAYRRDRQRGGAVHAWVAIALGSLTTLANLAVVVLIAAARSSGR